MSKTPLSVVHRGGLEEGMTVKRAHAARVRIPASALAGHRTLGQGISLHHALHCSHL